MSGRRERWGIMGAILTALEAEGGRVGAVRLTMVASQANIAYDRLLEYLGQLEAMGLTSGRPPRLTPEGIEFLTHYHHWLSVLQRYGFAAPEAVARMSVADLGGDAPGVRPKLGKRARPQPFGIAADPPTPPDQAPGS